MNLKPQSRSHHQRDPRDRMFDCEACGSEFLPKSSSAEDKHRFCCLLCEDIAAGRVKAAAVADVMNAELPADVKDLIAADMNRALDYIVSFPAYEGNGAIRLDTECTRCHVLIPCGTTLEWDARKREGRHAFDCMSAMGRAFAASIKEKAQR
jgi:hypothetical protein